MVAEELPRVLSPLSDVEISPLALDAAASFTFDSRSKLIFKIISQLPDDVQEAIKRIMWQAHKANAQLRNTDLSYEVKGFINRFDNIGMDGDRAINEILAYGEDQIDEILSKIPESKRQDVLDAYNAIKDFQEGNNRREIELSRSHGLEIDRPLEAQEYHTNRVTQDRGLLDQFFTPEIRNLVSAFTGRQAGTTGFLNFFTKNVQSMEASIARFLKANATPGYDGLTWRAGKERMYGDPDAVAAQVGDMAIAPKDVRPWNFDEWVDAESKRLAKLISEGKTRHADESQFETADKSTKVPYLGSKVHDITVAEMLRRELDRALQLNALESLPDDFFTRAKELEKHIESMPKGMNGKDQLLRLLFRAGDGMKGQGNVMGDVLDMVGRSTDIPVNWYQRIIKGAGSALGSSSMFNVLVSNVNPAVMNLVQGTEYMAMATDAVTTADFLKNLAIVSPVGRVTNAALGFDPVKTVPSGGDKGKFGRSFFGKIAASNTVSNEMLDAAVSMAAKNHLVRLYLSSKLGAQNGYLGRILSPEDLDLFGRAIESGDDATLTELSRGHAINLLDIINGSGVVTSKPQFMRGPIASEALSLVAQPLSGSLNLMGSSNYGGMSNRTGLQGVLQFAKRAAITTAMPFANLAIRSSPFAMGAGTLMLGNPTGAFKMAQGDRNETEQSKYNRYLALKDLALHPSVENYARVATVIAANYLPMKLIDANDLLHNSSLDRALGGEAEARPEDAWRKLAGIFPKQTGTPMLAYDLFKLAREPDKMFLERIMSDKSPITAFRNVAGPAELVVPVKAGIEAAQDRLDDRITPGVENFKKLQRGKVERVPR